MIDLTQFKGHTPGPWHISDYVCIDASDDTWIATARRGAMLPSCENARLIAAAPDLLAENRMLRELVADALASLRATEFEAFDAEANESYCLGCGNAFGGSHGDDCPTAAMIARLEAAQ